MERSLSGREKGLRRRRRVQAPGAQHHGGQGRQPGLAQPLDGAPFRGRQVPLLVLHPFALKFQKFNFYYTKSPPHLQGKVRGMTKEKGPSLRWGRDGP